MRFVWGLRARKGVRVVLKLTYLRLRVREVQLGPDVSRAVCEVLFVRVKPRSEMRLRKLIGFAHAKI